MRKRVCWVLFILFACFLLLSTLLPSTMWDGGFPIAEYRVSLKTENGVPVTDAVMSVVNSSGENAVRYPVVQYDGETPIASDGAGVFTFHQVNSGFQFGGRFGFGLGFLPTGTSGVPR